MFVFVNFTSRNKGVYTGKQELGAVDYCSGFGRGGENDP
jgi:hypothetical protein